MTKTAAELNAEIESALAVAAISKPLRMSVTDPATMSAAQINKELDKLADRDSVLTTAMIESGRGYERPTDYRYKTDPLSTELNALSNRRMFLRIEIESRYGPGAPSRLPSKRGWYGPRRKRGEE